MSTHAASSPDEDPILEGGLQGRNLVASVLHGLTILDMYGRDRRTIAIGEMAKHLKLHKSSASRLAATLAAAGYLELDSSAGVYRLGGRLAAVGRLAAEDLDIERVVVPFLDELTWKTGETGHLAILDGNDTRTLAVTDGWHTVRMHSWVGKVSPAYCSSMGKALLAGRSDAEVAELYRDAVFEQFTERTVKTVNALLKDLKELRAKGFGFDDEELEPGLRCVSAPIVGGDGSVVASISLSGPTQRLDYDAVAKIAEQVRWAAAQASTALGARPATPTGWAPPPTAEPGPLDWVEQVRPGSSNRRQHP